MGGKNKNLHDIIYHNNGTKSVGRFIDVHDSSNYNKSRHKLYFATCSVCGTVVEKTIDELKRSALRCTCNKNMVSVRDDLTGRKIERLYVIERAPDYVNSKGVHFARWRCQCDCGSEPIIVWHSSLQYGNTSSCGCLKEERIKETQKKENKKDLSGLYGIIWSTNTNEEIYFDLDVADIILQHTWYVDAYGYAVTNIDDTQVKMHILLGYKWHDHHNRNRLDNRSKNLVSCTIQENNRNKSIRSDNTSGIIGVNWNKNRNKWVARIYPEKNKEKRLGYFDNKDDAIVARLNAEVKYYGKFAPQRHLFEKYNIIGVNANA